MSRFRVWLRKESLEHRRASLALVGALALLDFGAVLSWGGSMRTIEAPVLAMFSGLVTWFLAIVLLGGPLFARERGRGSLAWIQRLSGGLASSFAAKLTFLASALIVSWIAQAGLLAAAWWLVGEGAHGVHCMSAMLGSADLFGALQAVSEGRSFRIDWSNPNAWSTGAWIGILALPLSLVAVLLASSISRRGIGAAFLILVACFAVISGAIWGLRRLEPVVAFEGAILRLEIVMLLAMLAAFAVAALRGARFGNGLGRALRGAAAIIGVAILTSGALFAFSLHHHGAIDPLSSDCRLRGGAVGPDGRTAFVVVTRDPLWAKAGENHGDIGTIFRYDLETGRWGDPLPDGHYFGILDPSHALGPRSLLLFFDPRGEGGSLRWWDLESDRMLTSADDQYFPSQLPAFRRHLLGISAVRDANGRRCALLHDRVIRDDGSETLLTWPDGSAFKRWKPGRALPGGWPLPGGWQVMWPSPDGKKSIRGTANASTGTIVPCEDTLNRVRDRNTRWVHVDPDHLVAHRGDEWFSMRFGGIETEALPSPPKERCEIVAALPDGRILLLDPNDGAQPLLAWDPRSGDHEQLELSPQAWPSTTTAPKHQRGHSIGRGSNGEVIVHLTRELRHRGPPDRCEQIAVIGPDVSQVSSFELPLSSTQVIGLRGDGSLVVISDERRVEVVHPR